MFEHRGAGRPPAVVQVVDEGIGHHAHVVDLGGGTALVVDPRRIPEAELAAASARGLDVVATADTHSHADFVSGGPELRARGARFLAPAAAGLAVPYQALRDGDRVALGRFTLKAIGTPGHTPDHLAYLLHAPDGRPVALFSGGSLMVGTVGRPDLLGPEQTEALARAQWRSLHDRILPLPDDLPVYPTHGAGSFCAVPGSADRTTTIGRERATNPLLQLDGEDEFVRAVLSGLGSFPPYFRRLPQVNRQGPRIYGRVPDLARLGLAELRDRIAGGAQLVDARPVAEFAAGHVAGAISIELRPSFATWVGWLLDPERPIVFVLGGDQDRHELVRQCLTVGVEDLAGELDGGFATWVAAGLPTRAAELVAPHALRGTVVDVRQADEYRRGHVPGASHVELGELAARANEVPAGPVTVVCGHGERAMTGASILERAGRHDVAVLRGGPTEWAAAAGSELATVP